MFMICQKSVLESREVPQMPQAGSKLFRKAESRPEVGTVGTLKNKERNNISAYLPSIFVPQSGMIVQ